MSIEKRNRNLFNFLSFGLAIILTGLSYFLKDNHIYSVVLLVLGISIVFFTLFFNYMLPFIALKINLYKDPKIFFNSKQTGAWAENTYEIARKEGGEIYATHIYQHRVPIEKDFAVNQLRKEISNELKFHRILIFDNQKDEIEWIDNIFSIDDSNLKVIVYFWKYINLTINGFTIGLIPRINILTFKNTNGTKYRTVIGLEKVRSTSDVDTRFLNLSICSSKKSIFELVKKYYENIQNHPEVENATNLETYKIKKNHFPIPPIEQGLLKDLISYSHKTESILHFGAFGHTALTLNNCPFINMVDTKFGFFNFLLITFFYLFNKINLHLFCKVKRRWALLGSNPSRNSFTN